MSDRLRCVAVENLFCLPHSWVMTKPSALFCHFIEFVLFSFCDSHAALRRSKWHALKSRFLNDFEIGSCKHCRAFAYGGRRHKLSLRYSSYGPSTGQAAAHSYSKTKSQRRPGSLRRRRRKEMQPRCIEFIPIHSVHSGCLKKLFIQTNSTMYSFMIKERK